MRVWAASLFMAAVLMVSCTPPSDQAAEHVENLNSLSGDSIQVLQLPPGLTEISGLAVASDQTVYAHDDEHGIIYEVDISTGEARSIFALGNPTLSEDFEGIAVHGKWIYLITSDGVLFESPIGAHQERVSYNRYETGIGELCEVEGLAVKSEIKSDPLADPTFLILCKSPRENYYRDRLTVFKWTFGARMEAPTHFLSIDRDLILTSKEQRRFNPSAIEWVVEDQTMFVISARNRQVLHLNEEGDVLSKHLLDELGHPQSEGLTIMPNGDWIIADEGQEGNPGTLSRYLTGGP